MTLSSAPRYVHVQSSLSAAELSHTPNAHIECVCDFSLALMTTSRKLPMRQEVSACCVHFDIELLELAAYSVLLVWTLEHAYRLKAQPAVSRKRSQAAQQESNAQAGPSSKARRLDLITGADASSAANAALSGSQE